MYVPEDDLTRKVETCSIPCSRETERKLFRLDRLRYTVIAESVPAELGIRSETIQYAHNCTAV